MSDLTQPHTGTKIQPTLHLIIKDVLNETSVFTALCGPQNLSDLPNEGTRNKQALLLSDLELKYLPRAVDQVRGQLHAPNAPIASHQCTARIHMT
jgi:hypothetical protein